MPARYQHDCASCRVLGRYREFDLYYCPQGNIPTVLARYGNEPWEYTSGMPVGITPPGELTEAKQRAIEAGFVRSV